MGVVCTFSYGARNVPGPTAPRGSSFEPMDDHRYQPTAHAGGAWDPDEQHVSPLGGLVVHAIGRHRAAAGRDEGLLLSRISYDILGLPRPCGTGSRRRA
ncbi:hypothetical protein S1361_04340 [Streptomyces cyanogenus]|uniref:Uncharacterized protein n=1 Tax=Streptomyces cyanogenus TaxID=80860 RepID=A0ABX7TIY5_STRCY|nr:hypothetical protein S1361_04340 [Streptomyces cyanogenus]